MTAAPQSGQTAEAFDYAAEMMALARLQLEIGERFCSTGDLAGVTYAMRRHRAYWRAAVDTVCELTEAGKVSAQVAPKLPGASLEART